MVSKQFKIDEDIIELCKSIERTFDFVQEVQEIRNKVDMLQDVVARLLRQTTECCLFVRNLMQHSFAGKPWRDKKFEFTVLISRM